jgi:hypothetical protein
LEYIGIHFHLYRARDGGYITDIRERRSSSSLTSRNSSVTTYGRHLRWCDSSPRRYRDLAIL